MWIDIPAKTSVDFHGQLLSKSRPLATQTQTYRGSSIVIVSCTQIVIEIKFSGIVQSKCLGKKTTFWAISEVCPKIGAYSKISASTQTVSIEVNRTADTGIRCKVVLILAFDSRGGHKTTHIESKFMIVVKRSIFLGIQ